MRTRRQEQIRTAMAPREPNLLHVRLVDADRRVIERVLLLCPMRHPLALQCAAQAGPQPTLRPAALRTCRLIRRFRRHPHHILEGRRVRDVHLDDSARGRPVGDIDVHGDVRASRILVAVNILAVVSPGGVLHGRHKAPRESLCALLFLFSAFLLPTGDASRRYVAQQVTRMRVLAIFPS